MGSSQSQLGPGIDCAVSVGLPPPFDFSKWHLRVTFEGWTCVRARSKEVPEVVFRGQGALGMRLKPIRVQAAQEGAIMMVVCELS
jgi:hypothetical protein